VVAFAFTLRSGLVPNAIAQPHAIILALLGEDGGGALDSHLETPSIDRTLRALQRADMVPYREMSNELPIVMVNHAAYPR